jgi:hypothetical protein
MSRKLITTKLSRRHVLRMGATGAALGMGGLNDTDRSYSEARCWSSWPRRRASLATNARKRIRSYAPLYIDDAAATRLPGRRSASASAERAMGPRWHHHSV